MTDTKPPPTMAETSAPPRMKMSHPNEFTPKAIFFLTPTTLKDTRDWDDCFNMKASAVYSAIFHQQAAVDKTLDAAGFLLKEIAKNCNRLNKGEKIDSAAENPKIENTKTADLDANIKITIDAVYLVMSFLQDIHKEVLKGNDREKLDKYFMSRYGSHVLSDIAMLDNQLPLDLLIKVFQNLTQAVKTTYSQLKKSAGNDLLSPIGNWQSLEKFELSFGKVKFHEVVSYFSWYYSPFYVDNKFLLSENDLPKYKTLVECLHHCLVQLGRTNASEKSVSTRNVWPVPTAKGLRQAGVRFEAITSNWPLAIKFQSPSLKLPVLFFDSKLQTVAMNLLALESSQLTRPITRYYQMMNELVDDVGDVRALKKYGIVRGWKKEEDVVSFVKMVDGFASYPSMYPALDLVMEEVKKFHDAKMNRFLGRYRPDNSWVPYVAAATIIFSTAIIVSKRRR